MRSSWGLSLVFGRAGAAATPASRCADALEPLPRSPALAVLLLPAGATSELLLVEAAAGTGIRHTELRS